MVTFSGKTHRRFRLNQRSTIKLRALQHYAQNWTVQMAASSATLPSAPDSFTKPELLPALDQQDEIGDLARCFEQLLKMLVSSRDEVAHLYEESRKQSAFLTATFQSITDGIIIYDNQGNMVQSNAASEQLLSRTLTPGLSIQERMQLNPLSTLDGKSVAWEDRPSQRSLRESFSNYELSLASSKGLPNLILNYSGGPILDDQGQQWGSVIILRDVTPLKETEARLIAQRAEVMALKESNEVKNHFISVASHQLRTPLTGVMGFAELLTMRQLSPEIVQEYAQDILSSAERMNTLLNEMLNLQRLEAGKVEFRFETVDLGEVVSNLLTSAEFQPCQNIELVVTPLLPRARVDKRQLNQALANLLNNALNYSLPDSPVVIRLTSAGEG
ncbi:MAG: PAS domain-containing sensor histidine kinase, partial [Chloroflexota bacterium]